MRNAPKNLRYTKTHEWLDNSSDEMKVGITDHAQQLLGDMVYVELPQVGDIVKAGDEIGVLESVKAAADFYAPISGTITMVNQEVCENPQLLNSDPYEAGWLVKIKADYNIEVNNLLDEDSYQSQISQEH